MIERGKEKGFRQMVIAGAGAAGISAALCAAKRGLQVDLIESSPALGGTAVGGMIHTLAGFLDLNGHLIDSEICHELYDRFGANVQKRKMGKFWVLQIEPDAYGETVRAWLKECSGIQLHLDSRISELQLNHEGVHAAQVTGPKKWTIPGGGTAFVDTTGGAQVALLANQVQDDNVNSFALIFRFEVNGAKSYDRAVRTALKMELESLWPYQGFTLWLDSGFTDEELFLKLTFSGPENAARDFATRIEETLPNVLFKHPQLRLFTKLRVGQLIQRGGSRLISKLPNPAADKDRTFEVAWPFELWQGPNVHIQIPPKLPFRLSENFLHAADVVNLFAAGKCAGIPAKEMSAARVVGGCWAMGEQVAKMVTRYRE